SVAESSVSGVFRGRALCAGPFWPRITPKDTERFQVFGSSSVQSVSSVAESSVSGAFRGRALCAGPVWPRITQKDTERFQVFGSSSVQSGSSVAGSFVGGVFRGRAVFAGSGLATDHTEGHGTISGFRIFIRAIRVVRG